MKHTDNGKESCSCDDETYCDIEGCKERYEQDLAWHYEEIKAFNDIFCDGKATWEGEAGNE